MMTALCISMKRMRKGEIFVFCRHCGSEIKEGGRFCTNCGKPVTEEKVVLKKAETEKAQTEQEEGENQEEHKQETAQEQETVTDTHPTVNLNKKPMAGDSDATACMVLGIVSIVICSSSIPGIICGIMAIFIGRKAQRQGVSNTNIVTAGTVCGIIGIILAALSTVWYIGSTILGIIVGFLS